MTGADEETDEFDAAVVQGLPAEEVHDVPDEDDAPCGPDEDDEEPDEDRLAA